MINDPKLIKRVIDQIENTSKEDLDEAIRLVDKEDFDNAISEAIDRVLNYQGVVVKYPNKCDDLDYIEISNYETALYGDSIDDHMVVYTLMNMFKEGKVQFVGDYDKDVNYLRKLLKLNKGGV